MDSKQVQGNVKYLVKWAGWPRKKDWTWELYKHFDSDRSLDVII